MAEAARRGADEERDRAELERLRAETRDLRARARAHPLISQAQGVLRERYRLPDGDSAFGLLQRSSQRFNVKLRSLADAVLTTPRPEEPDALWFPRRVRSPEPALDFPAPHRPERGNRGAVLSAVLSQTLAVVDTSMGNVQVTDRVRGGLRLEKHTGLSDDFVDFFAYVGDEGTACAAAARDLAQVTVHDVSTDPVFTEAAREQILAAGSLGCHSVPLTTVSGLCLGMVSAHTDHTLRRLSDTQLRTLDMMGAQAGRWLSWHDRTVVMDALEYLHALGRRGRGARIRRS
ncbi:ANTAR domain-containing protein [Streptomyces sp. NPDC092369]|uniref:ANTAR domain-containing protein n=1 Tax=Streptomyces sp. NPDC092369 TaxID=3366015 RepID=UPI0037F4AEAF